MIANLHMAFISRFIFPAFVCGFALHAADQPQWGSAWTRNMVSDEKGLPDSFDPETGRNILWIAPLGTHSHATPIVAGGRVYVGTNNARPRDPQQTGDRGVLLCLDEKDGSLLWQLVVPKREDDKYFDWPEEGICSPVTVEGDRAYVVTNRHEVVCLDVAGMANGNDGPFKSEAVHRVPHLAPPPAFQPILADASSSQIEPRPKDADIVWLFDMPSEAGIWPHDGAHSSILVHGDFLYVNTGTGVDNSHKVIRTPDAPSLIVLEKKTGRYLAREREGIAPNIFHSTWSAPSLARIGGEELIFFCGGDGIVRAFEPLHAGPPTGELARLKQRWQFDPDPNSPKDDPHRFLNNRQQGPSNIYAMPVVCGERLLIAGGGDVFWGKNDAWLKCIDAAGKGEVWSYPLDKHTLTTPVCFDGLVFAADTSRHIHCVEFTTGKPVWVQDTKGDFWASPLIADGKLYLGSRKGDFWVMSASREKKVLSAIDLKRPISATATAVNGVLYVATMEELYAIKDGAQFSRQ
jgi:outer membrane protein assembly factor BamB